MIRGEAGIGKTRLASELLRRAAAAGRRTAACAALDLGGGAPFGLWAELTARAARAPLLAAARARRAGPTTSRCSCRRAPSSGFGRPPAPRPTVAPELERARLFEAVVAAARVGGARPPAAARAEDDVHVADAPSLELAGYVARRIGALPVVMLLTRRELPRRAELDRARARAARARRCSRAELALGAAAPTTRSRTLARDAGPARRGRRRRGSCGAAEGNALLAPSRPPARARAASSELAAQPARRGARRARAARRATRALAARRAAVAASPARRAREMERLPLDDPADGRHAGARDGHARRRGRAPRLSPRAAARRGLRGAARAPPRRAAWALGADAAEPPATGGQRPPRSRATCAPPDATGRPSRSSRAPPPTRAASAALARRPRYPAGGARATPRADPPSCGSSWARSRRGARRAPRPRRRSRRRSELLDPADRLRARARLAARRAAGTTARSASRARCATAAAGAGAARPRCADAAAVRSAARRSPRARGPRRSRASVEEAERLLVGAPRARRPRAGRRRPADRTTSRTRARWR